LSEHGIEFCNIGFTSILAGAGQSDFCDAIGTQGPPAGSAHGNGVGISVGEAFHEFSGFWSDQEATRRKGGFGTRRKIGDLASCGLPRGFSNRNSSKSCCQHNEELDSDAAVAEVNL